MGDGREQLYGMDATFRGAVPVEPLDPLLLAEDLEHLATRQEAVERAFDALARRLGDTPKEGPLKPAQHESGPDVASGAGDGMHPHLAQAAILGATSTVTRPGAATAC